MLAGSIKKRKEKKMILDFIDYVTAKYKGKKNPIFITY
jgi:hypothetical protein